MLNFHGGVSRLCDGVPRRSFLKVGALSFGAASLTLADVYRAEAANPQRASLANHKAVINVFLGGGPPHQDTFDLKMDAPAEIRGEMKPIQTSVPGIEICEVLPKMARMMDKFAIVRSIVGATGGHDAYQCTTGWRNESLAALGGRPSIGSVLAKLHGPVDPSVPPFVGLAEKTQHGPWSDPGKTGFLGSTFGAFKPNGPDIANMKMNGTNSVHMGDRKQLLAGFDNLRRELDANGSLAGMDSHTERAMNVLTSSRLIEALDVSREDPKIRDRYGDGKPFQFQYDGAPTVNEHLLVARRLVQAGARCVTLSYGRWDSHGKNFDLVRDHGSKLDQCLTALVWDLERLDMLDDVTVVAWGEFGRTPRINKEAGRDHWPQVSCALLAGGGMPTGQVIGATDRIAGEAASRPVTWGELFATLYRNLGIDSHRAVIEDLTGRPQYLVEDGADPLRELV